MLASTSETYGDPLVNPPPESYWGNVNPIGPRGEDITVYGDGVQMRSFCYVSDLIDGIYRLMMSNFVEPVDDPKVRRRDIGRAKDVLGWEPVVGLERIVGYFEK